MTYASGGLIQATDYNGFVNSINTIWGAGSGDSGYGQSTTLATVAASNTVTAVQWSNLIARMNSISIHQSGSGSGITPPVTGNIITYVSTLSGKISTYNTNRLSAATRSGNVTMTAMTNATTWGAATGVQTCTKEVSLTWPNANAMRYFFNCGGYAEFTGQNSVLSTNTKSTDWDALLSACGVVRIRSQSSSKVGGSGTPSVNNTNLGFHDLTTSYQIILRQYSTTATGGYNLNYATFEAKLNAAVGSATVLSMKMTLSDVSTDNGIAADGVVGTVQLDYYNTPPEVTNLANVWGLPTGANITNTQL